MALQSGTREGVAPAFGQSLTLFIDQSNAGILTAMDESCNTQPLTELIPSVVTGAVIEADPTDPPIPVFGNTYKFPNAGGLGANFNVYLTVADNGVWNQQGWFEDTDIGFKGTCQFVPGDNYISQASFGSNPSVYYGQQLSSDIYAMILTSWNYDDVSMNVDNLSVIAGPDNLQYVNRLTIINGSLTANDPLRKVNHLTIIGTAVTLGPNSPTNVYGTVTDTDSSVLVQIDCTGLTTLDLTEFASYAGTFDLINCNTGEGGGPITEITGLSIGRNYKLTSSDNSLILANGVFAYKSGPTLNSFFLPYNFFGPSGQYLNINNTADGLVLAGGYYLSND